ncbi:MAG TPA: alanine--tRNA ligase [Verrucomicrobiae bacterium]|nr:alanine--tRNA ligase [Verrucomicrobiae bacterium]
MSTATIRTGKQIRQDFLDFFKSKQHTIVPSSSLMPDSPNLLFTNAGMNQFVPIFLGQTKCPYMPGRAADTQKCIRAGGKHNDLDDVGLDTYHHTFFEMLGNWSFGDYFKKEAIAWAWELVIEVWKFPPQRVYATIYQPDKSKNDPADRDQEAWELWAEKFRSIGLDPEIHIVNGNKKDNFWMMGETGPCGPCTEVHIDLRPGPRETDLDTQASGRLLVNGSDARCIEIWNNVFIQYNANPDGTFSPLPAQHVDTGMGFERVTSIIQGTKGLTDFQNAKISNYETDIFRPIFDALEKMSGKKYGSTLPGDAAKTPSAPLKTSGEGQGNIIEVGDHGIEKSHSNCPDDEDDIETAPSAEQIALDVAFRVIADHIRTLSFAIADGIQPGNTDRNYVLRRILRRAVRYGRTLGFREPFFYKLVDVLAETMGEVFPEIRAKKKIVQETIQREEEAFNKTLDKGLSLFEAALNTRNYLKSKVGEFDEIIMQLGGKLEKLPDHSNGIDRLNDLGTDLERLSILENGFAANHSVLEALHISGFSNFLSVHTGHTAVSEEQYLKFVKVYPARLKVAKKAIGDVSAWNNGVFGGFEAFILYDTYGFPLDLTELMARERGLTVDKEGFEKLMEEQRNRARAAQKKEVISLSQIETTTPTKFVGYDNLATEAKVLEVVSLKDKTAVILDTSSAYAEMGGQVGDTGELTGSGQLWRVTNTQKSGNTFLHFIEGGDAPAVGAGVTLAVEKSRRDAIQRHHTVTHLLHWALHEVASKEASQKGSSVGPDKLTFDFNSAPLTPAQVVDIEKLVNERILENAGVSWTEVAHADVKNRKDIMQFFGDKYGDTVRVVQIGGHAHKLDGYSMELCGGTHTRATGEIGLFRIVSEAAVAAGVRRIEAVAGLSAYDLANQQLQLIRSIAGKINSPVGELEKKIDALLAHQKELEKSLKLAQQREAAGSAKDLVAKAETINDIPAIIANLGANDGDTLQAIADSLKSQFKGVIVLGGAANGAVTLIAAVSPDFTAKVQAGKIIQTIAPIVGGKGGGKPDNARGGGKDAAKLDEALAKVKTLLV